MYQKFTFLQKKRFDMSIELLKQVFRSCVSRETCYPFQGDWSPEVLMRGQSDVVALVLQDLLGGVILYCAHFRHYWNQLPDGRQVDLTIEDLEEYITPCVDKVLTKEQILNDETSKISRIPERYNLLKGRILKLLPEMVEYGFDK